MSFELIILVGFLVLIASFFGNVFRKAGFSVFLGLLMLIPGVNAIVFIVFCLIDWPVQYDLARLRLSSGEGGDADASLMFTRATKLDRSGDWEGSIRLYGLIASGMAGTDWADDANQQIEAIREKQAMAGLV